MPWRPRARGGRRARAALGYVPAGSAWVAEAKPEWDCDQLLRGQLAGEGTPVVLIGVPEDVAAVAPRLALGCVREVDPSDDERAGEGRASPARTRSNVVLPEPLGPSTTQISSSSTASVNPCRAATPPVADGYTAKSSRASTSLTCCSPCTRAPGCRRTPGAWRRRRARLRGRRRRRIPARDEKRVDHDRERRLGDFTSRRHGHDPSHETSSARPVATPAARPTSERLAARTRTTRRRNVGDEPCASRS